MNDEQPHQFTIVVRVTYALWPGDGGRHELAPYRFGMLGGRR